MTTTPYDLSVYDAAFYETYGHEAESMSKWFLPLLNEVIPFESLVDVGAGEGWYVRWCLENGKEAHGVEGSDAALERSVAGGFMRKQDLRVPFRLVKKYDLCLSLEVAEHIEEEYAPVFVESLCSLSDTVVMTAAPPGQGGLMHCNEQPKSYWVSLFRKQGFWPDWECVLKLREGIAAAIQNREYVTPWLVPNLIIFRIA